MFSLLLLLFTAVTDNVRPTALKRVLKLHFGERQSKRAIEIILFSDVEDFKATELRN